MSSLTTISVTLQGMTHADSMHKVCVFIVIEWADVMQRILTYFQLKTVDTNVVCYLLDSEEKGQTADCSKMRNEEGVGNFSFTAYGHF